MTDDFQARSARIAEARAKGSPVSYEICINEPQRTALLELIRANVPQGNEGPLDYWVSMLEGLPHDELQSPGCLHGFCL